jgi:hypothetical protein
LPIHLSVNLGKLCTNLHEKLVKELLIFSGFDRCSWVRKKPTFSITHQSLRLNLVIIGEMMERILKEAFGASPDSH